ncbi:MAG: Sec-independent protein translocase protein TatB [Acidimicrobiia bacterium]|nr:Sec-independent protein translocase protein TatB [Acidimicrobiia bacterium]MCY4433566.1 Sec-independent protein translocase protein TatB [bacterium]
MGNLGWAEVVVILVVALVVLGPDKLPGAARQIGNVVRQLRRISTGFQQELQNALDEPVEAEARKRGQLAVEQSRQESAQKSEGSNSNVAVSTADQGEPGSAQKSEPGSEQASDSTPSSQ